MCDAQNEFCGFAKMRLTTSKTTLIVLQNSDKIHSVFYKTKLYVKYAVEYVRWCCVLTFLELRVVLMAQKRAGV